MNYILKNILRVEHWEGICGLLFYGFNPKSCGNSLHLQCGVNILKTISFRIVYISRVICTLVKEGESEGFITAGLHKVELSALSES